MATGTDHVFDSLLGDKLAHAVVNAPACQNDLRVVAEHVRFMGEIVGIDTNAMTAYQAGAEWQEVPFGAGGLQDFQGVDADLVKDDGQFVHQGDIEIALGVFDDFGGFCHFDTGGPVDTGCDNGFVELGDFFQGVGIVAGNHFQDFGDGVFFITRVDPFR